jgi:hypothetical protein
MGTNDILEWHSLSKNAIMFLEGEVMPKIPIMFSFRKDNSVTDPQRTFRSMLGPQLKKFGRHASFLPIVVCCDWRREIDTELKRLIFVDVIDSCRTSQIKPHILHQVCLYIYIYICI